MFFVFDQTKTRLTVTETERRQGLLKDGVKFFQKVTDGVESEERIL